MVVHSYSLLCSTRVRYCHRLLVEVVDWYASLAVRLICCQTESKLSMESVDLPLTFHPSSSLITFAFRSNEERRLFLDLDPCGGTDPLVMFPFFLKRTADVLAPHLSVVFGGFFVWLVSLLDGGNRPMSPLFRRVHRPPLLPIPDRFP